MLCVVRFSSVWHLVFGWAKGCYIVFGSTWFGSVRPDAIVRFGHTKGFYVAFGSVRYVMCG